MSYDLTIWKWAKNRTATPVEVFDAIGTDEAHPAMQRFDIASFTKALYAEFGGEQLWSDDANNPPFIFSIADFTGTPANWITINMGYGRLEELVPKLIRLGIRHGLVVFDHQTETINGSRID